MMMGSSRVLGVTGMPLSGKTTVARILERNGYTVVDMGDVVRKEMKNRGVPSENVAGFVNGQREDNGMDAIAELTIPYLKEAMARSDRIVITGMRGWSEKQRFEEFLDESFEVVAVWASRETRKRRREERMRKEDIEGQEFHERDLREIDNGMAKLMALSDSIIVNDDKSLDELEKEVRKRFLGDR